MASVGLFFGSDTGNTEHVAKMIQKELGKQLIDVKDIAKSSKEDIAEFDLLIFGIPTWYYGEAQCDWDKLKQERAERGEKESRRKNKPRKKKQNEGIRKREKRAKRTPGTETTKKNNNRGTRKAKTNEREPETS